MRSLLIGSIAAMTLGIAAAGAQNAETGKNAPDKAPAATTTDNSSMKADNSSMKADTSAMKADTNKTAENAAFIDKQDVGLVRAPKLVGVAVYDSNNKSVGKIADILLDKSGDVKAVVIGVGGFLGIGSKNVALPYNSIHWQTEQRTVATNEPAPANGAGTTNNTGGGMATTPSNNAATATKVDPAATEAYQGYPDRAVVDLSQDQLKAAPEFKYAENPESKAAASSAPVKQ
jgi:sporulation protein YlmC with PRC-barrel domain